MTRHVLPDRQPALERRFQLESRTFADLGLGGVGVLPSLRAHGSHALGREGAAEHPGDGERFLGDGVQEARFRRTGRNGQTSGRRRTWTRGVSLVLRTDGLLEYRDGLRWKTTILEVEGLAES